MKYLSKEDVELLLADYASTCLFEGNMKIGAMFMSARRDIDKLQSVDIVRCSECKHSLPNGKCTEFADRDVCPSANDFCSYGERKD